MEASHCVSCPEVTVSLDTCNDQITQPLTTSLEMQKPTPDSSFREEDKENDRARQLNEQKLVRKMDRMVMPILAFLNFAQSFSLLSVNYVALYSFKEDLKLIGNDYNILNVAFAVGYFVFQYPNTYLMQRLPLAKYLGFLLLSSGVCLFCYGLVNNFSQIVGVQLLSGILSGGIHPVTVVIISTLYRRREQTTRLCYCMTFSSICAATGGLISYGMGRVNTYGIAVWRWVFGVYGSIICFSGIIVLVFLIDNPRSCRLHLTTDQESIVEDRIRDNVVKRTAIYKKRHVMESLKELRYWALMMATCMITIESGMKLYESQITRSFGFTTFQSLLLSALVGLAECGFNLAGAYTARRTYQTLYTVSGLAAIGAIGVGLMMSPLPAAGKLVGQIIQATAPSVHIMAYLVIANNVSGYTKKIFYCGSVTAFVTIGHVAGQFAMAPQFAPQYTYGMMINLITKLLAACCLLLARWPMAKANRQRQSSLMTDKEKTNYVVEDVTDVQDARFIYRL